MASNAHRLLGPPEIRHSPAIISNVEPDACSSDPFVDLMDASLNNLTSSSQLGQQQMGLTENNSATFLSSGDPCLDFFFQVVPNTPSETIKSLLTAAWDQDSLTALKLVCHLRAICGNGKSDRKGFYTAALWLYEHHPKTLALNVHAIACFGYLKDFPEILHRLVAGQNTRKRIPSSNQSGSRSGKDMSQKKMGTKEERLAAEMAKAKIRAKEAANLRHEKQERMAANAVRRYTDPNFRLLHDRTSDWFALLLHSDIERLRFGNVKHFSLAAKWCPSLKSSYDRSTLLCEAIARRLFPRDSDPDYMEIEEHHYVYRVRDRLRKEVLVPLRRALHLPEVYMSAQQWGYVKYSRVATVAMKNYRKFFLKHDKKRFTKYLAKIKKKKAKIAADSLLPHQIVASVLRGEDDNVAELQWKRMVSDLSEIGKLRNCIAVCDVSGSMNGTPMEVCVALALLISELSEEPWKGKVINFSPIPQMHHIEGESLKEKVEFIKNMEWGMNTNFRGVFDYILDVAVEGKMKAEKMIKRVFVLSHKEFDQVSTNHGWDWKRNCPVARTSWETDYEVICRTSWETDYEVICRKYEESGYGSVVPEIVFWNLRDSRSTPVTSEKGVALVRGFSKNLVKLLLKGEDLPSPKDVMEAAIAGEEYKELVVFD